MTASSDEQARAELLAIARSLGAHLERLRTTGAAGTPAAPRQPPPAAVPRAEPPRAPVEPIRAVVAAPAAAPDPAARRARLVALAEEIRPCTRCALHVERRQTVFARGDGSSGVCFVGEGPGEDEDREGLPFVGKAGQLLDRMIAAMGLERDEVYVANIVKCLRYTTQVQLENGGWERIGRLVRTRYGGRVMSVTDEGRLVPKRVIGWHTSPLAGRRVYKLSYASSPARGRNHTTAWLTEDHPVLTLRGWVAARDLGAEDRVAVGQGLSDVAREVLAGTLLGEGHIDRRGAHLSMSHARDQREYVHTKARALQELAPIVYDSSTSHQTGRTYLTTVLRTRASRALRVLRSAWYPEGRKRVPPDLRLTPLSVATWFLDDGYTNVKSDDCALAELAARSFDADEVARLVEALGADLGVAAYVLPSRPGRILFGAEATLRLSQIIAPYCPPCLRRKLHPRAAEAIAYDSSGFDAGTPRTLYDRVSVEPVAHHGTDQSFFCLDVEDTHNFVTCGGVVHNCRPPKNRKPEPEEMAACRPYLVEQLALVDPKVIVALGATAVQGLLGATLGITKLRGSWKLYQGRIPVMPTFHPAYLLRTPSAKREVWQDLQEVLRHLGRPLPPKP